MVTEVKTTPTVEAKGDDAEGANSDSTTEEEVKGTPAESATVHPEDGGSTGGESTTVDELIYSESSFAAAREAALEEGKTAAIKERDAQYATKRKQLIDAVNVTDGARAPVLRMISTELKKLSSDLDDDDIEPIIKVARDAHAIVEEAAFSIVAEAYRDGINAAFANDAERKSFWESAEAVDPALDISTVLSLYADHKALSSRAISDADPESLIKANKKLAEHLSKERDKARKEGRDQGRKDPPGEPGAEGAPASADPTWAQIQRMNGTQLAALPPAVRERYHL